MAYGNRVRFVVEDMGASKLAESFGVDKYPAIFVDDALVARPEDFNDWGGPKTGRYLPWTEVANRRRFQTDLRQMIDIRLEGKRIASLPKAAKAGGRKALPDVELTMLDGKSFRLAELQGKPVLIEFWAPWCPHCMKTLEWMKKLNPGDVEIIAIAIETTREDVEAAVRKYNVPGRVVMGSQAVRDAFGGPPAIPTLVAADRAGAIARVFYGASPTLYSDVGKELARMK